MIVKANSCQIEMSNLLKPQNFRGMEVGDIHELNEHYTARIGNTTVLTGFPTSGKSYLALNILIGLTMKRKCKHFIYTPEMGSPAEIYLLIIEIITGLRVGHGLTEAIVIDLLPIVSEYFYVYDPENTPNMDTLCNAVKIAKQETGIHTFLIDNMNDLSHQIQGTQDIYFEGQLVTFNRTAKAARVHGFLLAHPRNPRPEEINICPSPDQIKGGSAWWSKAQNILSISRNEATLTVTVFKAKPRGTAKRGVFEIYLDMDKNTYYGFSGTSRMYLFDQTLKPW